MKSGVAQKSLRKRLIWQFSFFVTAIMAIITIVVAAMLTDALSRELKQSLNVHANHSLEKIESRVSFLEEKIKDFSKNHFVVNSLIDLQGRDAYLPQLVRDFRKTGDIDSVTIVDFEGNVIYAGSGHTLHYKKEVYLRTALAEGNTIRQLCRKHPENVIVAVPIEYYHTPQGAVIAEFNLAGIAARILTKGEKYCHKLYSKNHVIFHSNAMPDDKHISVIQQAGEKHPLMKHLGIGLQSGIFRSDFSAPVRNACTRLALIGFCIIAVSAILAARIGSNIAKPILQLCTRVAKATDGGGQKCSPLGTGDELEELAYVFDRRTEQLVSARKHQEDNARELKKINAQLQKEIAERQKAEQELRKFAQDLEQSNQEIQSFAYIVSHDLRAPLVNIKGFSTELRRALESISAVIGKCAQHLDKHERSQIDAVCKQDVPEALDFIGSSVNRMDVLISAILDFSRMGKLELKPQSIDMQALAVSILQSIKHQIEKRNTMVTVKALPAITADRTAMEQILSNILDNAVKYLDPARPGRIEISAQRDDGAATFHVRDNGRGIANEDIPKVFEIFRRAGAQDIPGEGMGLAFVKTLLRRHGGRIQCSSQPGAGTTFTFTIPNCFRRKRSEKERSADGQQATAKEATTVRQRKRK